MQKYPSGEKEVSAVIARNANKIYKMPILFCHYAFCFGISLFSDFNIQKDNISAKLNGHRSKLKPHTLN